MSRRREDPYRPDFVERSPFLLIWRQSREAIAEMLVPLLAGLKTVWLLLITPTNFFRTWFFERAAAARLHSPFGLLWRSLTSEPQLPLQPHQFLLFGIFTAALAGFGFDNSNRFTGFLANAGLGDIVLAQTQSLAPTAANLIVRLQTFAQTPTYTTLSQFVDGSIVSAVLELVLNLYITMAFALLFWLIVRGRVPANHSYSFWLYMTGLQYFTTGISSIFYLLFSLGLSEEISTFLFWLLETALFVIWQIFLPMIVLPRLYPAVRGRTVLLAALLGRGLLFGLGWAIAVFGYSLLALLAALFLGGN
ncbi:MAG: hypothetical protein KA314_11465 [Chloroflexi bacterium]|nr:hypothetical protein [Chloroflexota bacterium]MBP8056452.1 hypothetical protein [Chloroflexota bacterium]